MTDTHGARPRALVTGASGGIGWELAAVFAERGYDLVLAARRQRELDDRAEQLSRRFGIHAETVALDLAHSGAAGELASELERRGREVTVLVNNAGFAVHGAFADSDVDRQMQMLRLNIETLTHLTRLLLPGMLSRRRGGILNIASIGSYMPGPLLSTYFASKAYVLSFSQALAAELKGTGVTVTAVVAGPTRTGFARVAGLAETRAFRGHMMEPRDVAEGAYDAFRRGKTVAVPGWHNRLRMLPVYITPTRVLTYFARKYHELPSAGGAVRGWFRSDVSP